MKRVTERTKNKYRYLVESSERCLNPKFEGSRYDKPQYGFNSLDDALDYIESVAKANTGKEQPFRYVDSISEAREKVKAAFSPIPDYEQVVSGGLGSSRFYVLSTELCGYLILENIRRTNDS